MRDSVAQRRREPRLPFGMPGYALAGLALLATIAVQLVLNPTPNLAIPLLVSLLSVLLTAGFAGRNAALLATAANLLVNWYFFAAPQFSFAVASQADRWSLAIFALLGTGTALFAHRISASTQFPRVALMLAASLILVLVAVLVWIDFQNARASEGWVEHTYQVLNASERLLATVQDADARQRGYLLTGDEQYLSLYREVVSHEGAEFEEIRRLISDNARQQARLPQLEALIKARAAVLDEGITARQEHGIDAAIGVVRGGEGLRLVNGIRETLSSLERDEHSLLTQRTKAAAAEAQRTRAVLAGGTAVLVALLAFAGVIIEKDVGKLQSSARRLRRQADLLNKAHEPIFAWKVGGTIEYWNRGAEELYGFTSAEAVGRDPHALLRTHATGGIAEIERQLTLAQKWQGELTHSAGDREIVVESLMTAVTEPDGRITVLEANRDMTVEKQAQVEIQRLNEDLEQRVQDRTAQLKASNAELEAFAYAVSHDLRAPLRGIDGWSLALLEDYGSRLDQTARQYLDRVRSESQRMGSLIDDLLNLSRLTRVELQRESLDLSALARSIAERLHEAHPNRRMEFEIQEGLVADADGRLMDVVLTNLLSNAAKFTGPRERASIEFGRSNGHQELAYFVRDNGVGFDMAYADMLFGAFQRLHKYGEFPGTGIGLATAQRVVRRHGGRIWADAKPNEGATFYFTLGS